MSSYIDFSCRNEWVTYFQGKSTGCRLTLPQRMGLTTLQKCTHLAYNLEFYLYVLDRGNIALSKKNLLGFIQKFGQVRKTTLANVL